MRAHESEVCAANDRHLDLVERLALKNRPKVLTKANLPPLESPAAAEIMFCSAMRASK